MSLYRFKINKYHSINEADINLNGLTVIAGENGSGKSTVIRWLHYCVSTMPNYRSKLIERFIDDIRSRLAELRRLINGDMSYVANGLRNIEKNIQDEYFIDAQKDFDDIARKVLTEVRQFVAGNADDSLKRRLFTTIYGESLKFEENDYDDLAICVGQTLENEFIGKFDSIKSQLHQGSLKLFHQMLKEHYGKDLEIPSDMYLYESDVTVLDQSKISDIFMLDRSIYIDTPMALSESGFRVSTGIWAELRTMMFDKNKEPDFDALSLLDYLRNKIGGSVSEKRDELTGQSSLEYDMGDGQKFSIEDAATGLKSFAYLMRLIENGWLNNKTLLLIDEPEAHLHPQWVVEFARVLILIRKTLGTKIVIATHSPDFVAAIESISEAEKIKNDVDFYLSDKGNNNKYSYRHLGNNAEDIFASFNHSLEKIDFYGA